MIIYEITGKDRNKTYYSKSEEEFLNIMGIIGHNQIISIRRLEVTEEKYNELIGEKV